MKIYDLVIKNYKQFKDLHLDLSYPKGHKKEGEPLDKICIIGQSGTGKTNLLDIIKKSTIDFSKNRSYKPFSEFSGEKTDDKYITNSFLSKSNIDVKVLFTENDPKIEFKSDIEGVFEDSEKNYFVGVDKKNFQSGVKNLNIDELEMNETDKIIFNELYEQKEILISQGMKIHGVSGFQKKIKEINTQIKNIENKYSNNNTKVLEIIENIEHNNFINSSIIDINEQNNYSWELLKRKIDNYQVLRSQYNEVLSNNLLNDDSYSKEDYKTIF